MKNIQDYWAKKAKKAGLRSRAAYKLEEIITHLYSINKEIQSKEVSLLNLATQNKISREVFLKHHSLKDTYTLYQKHMISKDDSFKSLFQNINII